MIVIALLLSLASFPTPAPLLAQSDAPDYVRLSRETDTGTSRVADAVVPRIAFSPETQRYLLVYFTDKRTNTNNHYELVGQLVRADQGEPTLIGDDPFIVSSSFTREWPIEGTRIDAIDPTDTRFRPAVAYNSLNREFLAVWAGVKTADDNLGDPEPDSDEYEIFGRRVSATSGPIGGADFQISNQEPAPTNTDPAGPVAYDALLAAVAFNPVANGGAGEYLVVWQGDIGGIVDDHEFEVFGRRLAADGSPRGDQFRITAFRGTDPLYETLVPTVVANPETGEFVVAFVGRQPEGDEIYALRIGADNPPAGGVNCAFEPAPADPCRRLTDMGPDGDGGYDAYQPNLAYNPDRDEYLLVFAGVDLVLGEAEIFGQRLGADLSQLGDNDFRVSDVGTYGDRNFDAFQPSVAYNSSSREYMVLWQGDNLADGDREMSIQRISPEGQPLGIDDQQISFHGPSIDQSATLYDEYRAGAGALAANPNNDQIFAVWVSDDGAVDDQNRPIPDPFFGLDNGDHEVFGQFLVTPPTIAAIGSPEAGDDALIDEIENIERSLNSLTVTFSKPMNDSSGHTEPSDVTNPNNYRLIEGGDDRAVQTADCGPAASGDQRLQLNGVSYNPATRTATITPSAPITTGFYKLIVCGSLRDSRGRLLDGDNDGTREDDDGDGMPDREDVFSRTFSVFVSDQPPSWLVLLYLAGDDVIPDSSGLQTSLTEPLQRLLGQLASTPYNPAARIVVLYDGKTKGDSRIFVRERNILKDVTTEVAESGVWPLFPANRELDTGNIGTLRNFILWSRTTYPDIPRTMLSVVNHGGGWAPDFGLGQPRGGTQVQSGGWRGLSLDLQTEGGTSFSTRDTGDILAELGPFGQFDIIFFDACLMGMIESAYEIIPYTDYYIAGQNLLWAELPYSSYLTPQALTANTTPRALTKTIVERYNADSPGNQPFIISAVEREGLIDVVGLVNGLGQILNERLPRADQGIEAKLRAAYQATQKFDYDSSFVIDPTDGYVDLADFARELFAQQACTPTGTDELCGILDQLHARITGERLKAEPAAAPTATARCQFGDNAVIGRCQLSGSVRVGGENRVWSFAEAKGLSIYLPLGEKDIRPTGVDEQNRPVPEPQLDYYADPGQLAFTRDAQPWADLLVELDPNTPLRDPNRPYNPPFPLDTQRERLYLPMLRR